MLEILGYTVSSGNSTYTTNNLKNVPHGSTVSVNYRTSLKEEEEFQGVSSTGKFFFYLAIVLMIVSLFLIPEAIDQIKPKGLFDKVDGSLLFLILFVDSFALPFVVIYGIKMRYAKKIHSFNLKQNK